MKGQCFQCDLKADLSICAECQLSFCPEHCLEHREHLFNQMEEIKKDFHQFDDELEGDQLIQPSLLRVTRWENEAIEKIQSIAEQAREDLLRISNRFKDQVKLDFKKIFREVQSHEELDECPELKFSHWMDTLKQYRQILHQSFDQELIRYDSSPMPTIKVQDKGNLCLREKFQKGLDSITISADQRTITCRKSNWNGSTVCGCQKYSSGVHSIHFQVNEKGKHDLFFGITSAGKDPNPWNRRTPPYAYGWWQFPPTETETGSFTHSYICAGDRLTLTLDCDDRRIYLKHHRTDHVVDQPVSYEQCPFPWRIALVLYSPQDSITILP